MSKERDIKYQKLVTALTVVLLLITTSETGRATPGITWSGSLEATDTYREVNTAETNTDTGDSDNFFSVDFNLKAELNSGERQSGVVLIRSETNPHQGKNPQSDAEGRDSPKVYWAYLDLQSKRGTLLRVGRQKISWGSGFAWNPTNYIGADKNRSDLEALTPGVDAINYELCWGNALVVLALKPQNRWSDWDRAAKYSFQINHSDISLSAYQRDDNNAFGLDYATTLGNFTIYTEIASKTGTQWYIGDNSRKQRDNSNRYLHGAIGLNGNFDHNWMVLLEYYHNQEGWNDRETEDYLSYFCLLSPEQKGLFTGAKAGLFGQLRRNYLNMTIRKSEISDDLSLSANILYNIDDDSFLLSPQLEYQFSQNAFFKLTVNSFEGDQNSEFGPMNNEVCAKIILCF